MRTFPHNLSNPELEQMRLLWPGDNNLVMVPIGDASRDEVQYELVVTHGYQAAAILWGPDSHTGLHYNEPYRTNDLFRELPPWGSGYYILQGRRDDLIASASRPNIDAAGIEAKIKSSNESIKNTLLFRPDGKERLGLLVEMDASAYGEGKEKGQLEEGVWQAVQAVNEGLRDWERVKRDMVRVLERGKRLPVTEKGNVKRREAERGCEREMMEVSEKGC